MTTLAQALQARAREAGRPGTVDRLTRAVRLRNVDQTSAEMRLAFEDGDIAPASATSRGGKTRVFSFRTNKAIAVPNDWLEAVPAAAPVRAHAYQVFLAHTDPSGRQPGDEPAGPGAPVHGLWLPADDFAEASAAYQEFVEANDLRWKPGYWGGEVRDALTHVRVAFVNPDGKVWSAERTEVLHDPDAVAPRP